jgi:dihydroorotate dehydrogenase (fumarate)
VLKVLAAGGRVAMMTSALLRHGPEHVRGVLDGVRLWLEEHEHESVQQIQGSMSLRAVGNPSAFVRGNYMKVLRSYAPGPGRP